MRARTHPSATDSARRRAAAATAAAVWLLSLLCHRVSSLCGGTGRVEEVRSLVERMKYVGEHVADDFVPRRRPGGQTRIK